jgi:hypothetical protein
MKGRRDAGTGIYTGAGPGGSEILAGKWAAWTVVGVMFSESIEEEVIMTQQIRVRLHLEPEITVGLRKIAYLRAVERNADVTLADVLAEAARFYVESKKVFNHPVQGVAV